MITVASAVVFPRVLTEMVVVAPDTFWKAAPPLGIMLGWMVLIAAGMYYLAWAREAQRVAKGGPASPDPTGGEPRAANEETEPLAQGNPAELLPALIFGGLYALVLLGAAAAHDYFGPGGLYSVAVISGLHDLDAITLSTARFMEQGQDVCVEACPLGPVGMELACRAPSEGGRAMNRIYAWCGRELDQAERRDDLPVTHGLCPACRLRVFAVRKEEKAPSTDNAGGEDPAGPAGAHPS